MHLQQFQTCRRALRRALHVGLSRLCCLALVRSHPYSYNGVACRCNLTLWGSADSGATWRWLAQVEQPPSDEHDAAAYSTMLPLNKTHVVLVYERADYRFLTRRLQPLGLPRE